VIFGLVSFFASSRPRRRFRSRDASCFACSRCRSLRACSRACFSASPGSAAVFVFAPAAFFARASIAASSFCASRSASHAGSVIQTFSSSRCDWRTRTQP
jgi:hypothetical protein